MLLNSKDLVGTIKKLFEKLSPEEQLEVANHISENKKATKVVAEFVQAHQARFKTQINFQVKVSKDLGTVTPVKVHAFTHRGEFIGEGRNQVIAKYRAVEAANDHIQLIEIK